MPKLMKVQTRQIRQDRKWEIFIENHPLLTLLGIVVFMAVAMFQYT